MIYRPDAPRPGAPDPWFGGPGPSSGKTPPPAPAAGPAPRPAAPNRPISGHDSGQALAPGTASQQHQTQYQRSTFAAPKQNGPALQDVLFEKSDDRYSAPEDVAEHKKAPLPWKAAIITVAVGLVVAVAFGFIYVRFLRTTTLDPVTVVSAPSGEETAVILSPQEAVEKYLTALAEGDIEAALALGKVRGNGSRALLDPEAHSKMRAQAPITDIVIKTTDPKARDVEASYYLAGSQVQTTFPVHRNQNGSYELDYSTTSIVLELNNAKRLPMLLAGVEVEEFTSIELVPGVYELTTGLEFIEFPKSNTVTISSLQFAEDSPFPATPQLTGKGVEAFRTAVTQSLDRCVQDHSLAPSGCPQARRAPQPIVEGSVRWQLVGNPLSGSEPALATHDQTIATLNAELTITLDFEYADGSQPGTEEVRVSAQASANMLGSDGSKIAVQWQS